MKMKKGIESKIMRNQFAYQLRVTTKFVTKHTCTGTLFFNSLSRKVWLAIFFVIFLSSFLLIEMIYYSKRIDHD